LSFDKIWQLWQVGLRWDCTLEFLSPKNFFLTNMQTWDHPDAKFVLIPPPPLPCCFLWRFEISPDWNFPYAHQISCQTECFQFFFMIPTGFWLQERQLSCDGFRFCMEDHGTVPWLDIWSGFKIFVSNFFRFWWIPLKPGGIKKIGVHSPRISVVSKSKVYYFTILKNSTILKNLTILKHLTHLIQSYNFEKILQWWQNLTILTIFNIFDKISKFFQQMSEQHR
jgi:hypothetical protein